ncbi:MAG TPA: hypothetical protein VLK82_01035 [Candidatus Tectomicrobia bacterium]|nr:hypothetical protein [Candidatus Tectomicrobia bacterium]
MTTFRRRMLEDLQLRGLAPKTQQCYVTAVRPTGALLPTPS